MLTRLFGRLNAVLILSVSLPIAMAIAGIVFYVNATSHSMAYGIQRQSMANSCDSISKAVNRFVFDAQSLAGIISQDLVIRNAVQGYPEAAQSTLGQYLARYGATYWAMYVFDLQGKIVAGVDANKKDLKGGSVSEHDFVKSILSGESTSISDTVLPLEGNEGAFVLGVASAIKDTDG